jgi:hypothetical protein
VPFTSCHPASVLPSNKDCHSPLFAASAELSCATSSTPVNPFVTRFIALPLCGIGEIKYVR